MIMACRIVFTFIHVSLWLSQIGPLELGMDVCAKMQRLHSLSPQFSCVADIHNNIITYYFLLSKKRLFFFFFFAVDILLSKPSTILVGPTLKVHLTDEEENVWYLVKYRHYTQLRQGTVLELTNLKNRQCTRKLAVISITFSYNDFNTSNIHFFGFRLISTEK